MFSHIQNIYLSCMIICYIIPILIISYIYNENPTLSNILCNNKCQSQTFIGFLIAFFIFTILYENERNDPFSLYYILVLIASIIGLIYYDESNTVHYIFAGIAFIAILSFMIYHIPQSKSPLLHYSLILQIGLFIYILFHVYYREPIIFRSEVLYIANFAAYYLILHANIET